MIGFIKSTRGKIIISTILLSALFIFFTFNWYIELSSFSVGFAKTVLGVILFWVFDKYFMKEIDTIEELKKGNVAYALFMLSLALMVSAAIINS